MKRPPHARPAARTEQLSLGIATAPGAAARGKKRGPKRKATSGVPHRTRPVHKHRHPVHVTLRVRHGLPSLRQQVIRAMILEILREQRRKPYGAHFQIVEHSIQSNHLHLILEAADGPSTAPETRHKNPLRSGISGFQRAFAHRLNKLLGLRGSIFSDRYHRHDLLTPREVRNALRYVLQNHAKHVRASVAHPDPYSSAPSFTGWSTPPPLPGAAPEQSALPATRPRTWLLGEGWRRHGLLDLAYIPKASH